VNVKEYIESGVLEAYVLGALTESERAEVDANLLQYPELADEIAVIEMTMQRFTENFAKETPAGLQDKIWDTLQKESIPNSFSQETDESKSIHKTIPLERTRELSPEIRWQRAAIWIALVASLLVNFMLWSQRNKMQDSELAMQQHIDTMQQQEQQLAKLMDNHSKEIDIMADTSVHTIIMKSMKPGHPMVATVYWSSDKGATYVAAQKLPMPPKGMQYQMWVIQKGQPVSMGMLPNKLIASASMARLPMDVKEGQAFAISLEKEGGSKLPTPENIYVLGKI